MFGAEEFLQKICGGNDTVMYTVIKLGVSVAMVFLISHLLLGVLPLNDKMKSRCTTAYGVGVLIGAICIICKVDPFEFLTSIFK